MGFPPGVKVEAEEVPLQETYKRYADVMANTYGVSAKTLRSVIQCESGWNQSARGKAGGIGIAQYMKKTWNLFEKEFGEDLDIYSARDQLKLTAWAFSEGKQKAWTCWRKLTKV